MRATVGACRRTTAPLTAACTALVLMTIAAPAHAADCPFADAQAGDAPPADLATATVCLLNEQRAAAGLPALRTSTPLTTTAERYAAYMVSDEHFAHKDEDGHNVVYRVISADPSLADRWEVIGENLGWGTYSMASPREMVNGWMNSPTHRDNILYPRYDEVGVGVAPGAPEPGKDGALTYATVFGKLAPPQQRQASSTHRRRASCRRARRAHTRAARARAKRACAARMRSARRS